MKFLRLTSAISIAVFCLLALQVHLTAQELQRHSFADLIHDTDEIEGCSETSTPNPTQVATLLNLRPSQSSGRTPSNNDRGQIVGFAMNKSTGEIHGHLLTPTESD
jgi:hypothetical protein